jgi:hypothetical protein
MHRSGTSCLARILNAAGLGVGAHLASEAQYDNLTGHWEPPEMIRINDRILSASGGAWNQVPEKLVVDDDVKHEIQLFLAQFTDAPVVGWKDPRLTITFPAWRPYLPDFQLVACVRHPHAVASSLAERGGITFEEGVRLWTDYNERLLQHAAEVPRVFWFHYDGTTKAYAASLKSFCEYAGLKFSNELLKLYNPCLTHQFGTAQMTDHRAEKVYDRLLELARKDVQDTPQASGAPHIARDSVSRLTPPKHAEKTQPAAWPDLKTLEEHQTRIAQVIETLRGINVQQQRDQKLFLGVINRIQVLEERVQTVEETVESSRAPIEQNAAPATRRLDAAEPSAPSRIYRALRGFLSRRFASHSQ